MNKNVLLARTHPFIVSDMKPFLESCGYAATKPESLNDLATLAENSSGVVISLAISSSLGESADEIFARIRQTAPRVPVLFAAMLPFDQSKRNLERLAKQAGIQATILGVDTGNDRAAALAKPETFLYVSKDDLLDPTRRATASRMVRRHFR